MQQTSSAPDFRVRLETTRGSVDLTVHPEWAPIGAQRFRELVEEGYYNDVAFFRVLDGFVAQFGISGDAIKSAAWREKTVKDDPVKASNTRGTVTFAMAGPNTRTTQLFINYGDNSRLDSMGFSPFAEIDTGMEHVDALYADYGEGSPRGKGPDQSRIHDEGNDYLKSRFPNLDWVVTATILED